MKESAFILTPSQLISAGCSAKTLQSAVWRKQIIPVSRGKYDYLTLPADWKQKLKESLWSGLEPWDYQQLVETRRAEQAKDRDASGLIKEEWQKQIDIYRVADTAYLMRLKPRAGKLALPMAWVNELCRSAGMLTMLCRYETRNEIKEMFGAPVPDKASLRVAVLGVIAKEVEASNRDTLKGLSRVSNVQTLMRTEYAFRDALKAGREAALNTLIDKLKLANENRKIVGRSDKKVIADGKFEVHELLIMGVMANLGKSLVPSYRAAYRLYIEQAIEKGIQPVPHTTFRRHASNEYLQAMIAKERLGAAKSNNLYVPYVTAAASTYSNSMIAMDDWNPELLYKRLASNGVSWERDRLTVIFIIDHATKCPIGWSIDRTATGQSARRAIRRMLRGNGNRIAKEIRTDRGSAFTAAYTEQMKAICAEKWTYKSTNRPQANPAEAYIKQFLKAKASQLEGFVGGNMSAKHTDMPNPDYFPKAKELPTEQELHAIIEGWFADLASEIIPETGISRWSSYLANMNPTCKVADELELRHAFGRRTAKPVRINRGDIVIQIGQKLCADLRKKPEPILLHYYLPDYLEVLGQVDGRNHGKVMVYVDEDFPEIADLYNYDPASPKDGSKDSYLTTVAFKGEASKGFAEATAETNKELGKQHRRIVKFEADQDAFVEGIKSGAADLDNRTSVADGFIVDVNGERLMVTREGEMLDEDPEVVLAVPFTGDTKQFKTQYNEAERSMILRMGREAWEFNAQHRPAEPVRRTIAEQHEKEDRAEILRKFQLLQRLNEENNDNEI